jgi:hypothetical protein
MRPGYLSGLCAKLENKVVVGGQGGVQLTARVEVLQRRKSVSHGDGQLSQYLDLFCDEMGANFGKIQAR